jgi:O-acetyl-ADP-ribose deacetylase (regulator of RNase III)
MLERKINNSIVRLQKGDLTAMDIEAIVFYASENLELGSGFGNAIAVRGGTAIQEELKSIGSISTGEAVITTAGVLKSKKIIHAAGPRFQETDTEKKLRKTIDSALTVAEENGIRKIAFPPMGTGFYGIPLSVCANVMLDVIREHISNNTSLEEVVICAIDNREFIAFQNELED